MRVRFQAVITGLAAIALGSFAPSANGAIVSVNFQGSDAAALAPADSTGVEAAGNWNNVSGTSGSSIALNDSSGAASGITLSSFSYSGLATTNGGFTDHSSPQKTLFAGGLGVNYGSAKFTLTGLSAYTSYDVLIYYSGGNSFPQDRKAKVFDSASALDLTGSSMMTSPAPKPVIPPPTPTARTPPPRPVSHSETVFKRRREVGVTLQTLLAADERG